MSDEPMTMTAKADGGAFCELEPLQSEDLPESTLPFWKMTGPGAVLVGLSIGAGEIVIWPRLAAEYGASLCWAAMLGLFLQLWINLEVGRWSVATGESVYTAFARVSRWFVPTFMMFTILGWLAPGWARTSGLALKALLVGPMGWGSDTFWTALTFAGVAVLLFGPKVVYQSVEKSVELLVLLVVVGLSVVALAVGTADHWIDLGRGLVSFGQVPEGMSAKTLFTAMVFAGAGGTANLFYTFYLRDKQIGMGQRIPVLINRIRGREEAYPATGYTYPENETNAKRFGDWFRFVQQDVWLFFFALNMVTILLFIFGSLAVLHPRGIVPSTGQLIYDQAEVLAVVWGPAGRTLFLVVGCATLFSTQLTLVDGVSRSMADMIYTNFRRARERSMSWWYLAIAASWMVIGIGITWVMEQLEVSELGFLLNAGYMGGFAMAVYCPLLLFINLRYLPASAKPKPLNLAMMIIATCVYVGFAVACIYWEFASRLTGG